MPRSSSSDPSKSLSDWSNGLGAETQADCSLSSQALSFYPVVSLDGLTVLAAFTYLELSEAMQTQVLLSKLTSGLYTHFRPHTKVPAHH